MKKKVCTDLESDLIVKVNVNKVVGTVSAVLGIAGLMYGVLAVEGLFTKLWWTVVLGFVLGALFIIFSLVTFYGRFVPKVEYGKEPEEEKDSKNSDVLILDIRPITEFERLYTKVNKEKDYETLKVLIGVAEL